MNKEAIALAADSAATIGDRAAIRNSAQKLFPLSCSVAVICYGSAEFMTVPGAVPIDNSACERAIRPFCVGRANWHIIDSVKGAQASAVIYSIVETAKANNLKPYEYLKHLLTEVPKHMEDTDLAFLDDLLPWSDEIPDDCRKPQA